MMPQAIGASTIEAATFIDRHVFTERIANGNTAGLLTYLAFGYTLGYGIWICEGKASMPSTAIGATTAALFRNRSKGACVPVLAGRLLNTPALRRLLTAANRPATVT